MVATFALLTIQFSTRMDDADREVLQNLAGDDETKGGTLTESLESIAWGVCSIEVSVV